jgi:hypothetical protein
MVAAFVGTIMGMVFAVLDILILLAAARLADHTWEAEVTTEPA